jgi:hypothetical protein
MVEIYINRSGDRFIFTPDNEGNLLWEGKFFFSRMGLNEDGSYNFVDPSGGPFIGVGQDAGEYHSQMKGKEILGFEKLGDGFKLVLGK